MLLAIVYFQVALPLRTPLDVTSRNTLTSITELEQRIQLLESNANTGEHPRAKIRQVRHEDVHSALNDEMSVLDETKDGMTEQKPPSRGEFKRKKNPRRVFIDLGANCGNSYLKLRQKKILSGQWEVLTVVQITLLLA